MNKPKKCIVCTVAFLIATVSSISLFGLFSAWAMSALDPAQQEAVAAVSTPWISAQRDPATERGKPSIAARRATTRGRPLKTSIATDP